MFQNKIVAITGGKGFLGRALIRKLTNLGAKVQYESKFVVDLRRANETKLWFDHVKPDYVFHLAGLNGGIAFQKNCADIFRDNTLMALNVLDQCVKKNIKKVLSVVASCAYPTKEYDQWQCGYPVLIDKEIMEEYFFFDGEPHDSVAAHAYAKRNLQLATKFYKEQHGLNGICVCPTTLYGPGDSFDPEKTKLMGGIIKRFADAKENNLESVTCWGSGKPMREFLYIDDAVNLIIESFIKYNDSTLPLNLGTGQEISVKDLAEKVANIVDYKGEIKWDETKPDGQYRKRLDLNKMFKVLGEEHTFLSLDEGIKNTVEWYRVHKMLKTGEGFAPKPH